MFKEWTWNIFFKKTQIELLEIKSTMSEMKNMPEGIDRKLNTAEEKIS